MNRRIDGKEEGGENEASDGWKLNYSTLVDQGYPNYQRYFIRGFHHSSSQSCLYSYDLALLCK